MPVNTYEAMFVLDSGKAATNWDDTVQSIHGILGKYNAEIVASRNWDERRFAYPINGQKKGIYLLTYFKADGNAIEPIQGDIRLNEFVIRDQILKIHPKLVEHLIAHAMSSTPGVDEERGDDEFDDRPRRRRRDD
jgi:small subunit ribosomal protein S6